MSTKTTQSHLPNDLLIEILTWLPAKSLIRFKSLSKFCKFSMETDPSFIRRHRRRSCTRHSSQELQVIGPQICGELAAIHFKFADKECKNLVTRYIYPFTHAYNKFSEVFDGLVCFFNSEVDNGATLSNLYTQESIRLPTSHLEYSNRRSDYEYFIGLDSTNLHYKVLRIWQEHDNVAFYQTRFVYEVYTIGVKSWVRVNPLPEGYYPSFFGFDSVCVDGVLYLWVDQPEYDAEKIAAFDFGDEKFNMLSFPESVGEDDEIEALIQIDGLPTLISWYCIDGNDMVLKMWKLEDYQQQVWVMESISVSCGVLEYPIILGTVSDGEIVILDAGEVSFSLFYYDRTVRMSRAVELRLPDPSYALCVNACVGENMMPLSH